MKELILRNRVKVLLSVMVLILVPSLVEAQTTTSRVSGVVTDENGDPIADAKLTFISPGLQGDRETKTDANGRFLVALLPPGAYAVSVNAPGHQRAEYSFRLRLGEEFPLDISLSEGETITEEVTVYGTTSKLQTTAQGDNFEYTQQVETLPLTSRNLENVAQLAPNVSFGPTVSQNRDNFDLAIAGAPAMDTVVLLDGAEISDPLFGSGTTVYFEDALKELQVMTSGISAKYGRFQGGVLNAVTKTGSNEFAATARAEFDQEDWNEKTPFPGETQSDELNKTYWASASGRIIRDHLWFFAGGRTIPETSDTQSAGITGQSFTTVSNEDRWQLRLTGSVTPNHTVDVSYLEFEGETSNRAALPAAEGLAIGNRADPRDITTASYQGILSPTLFLDVKATEKNAAIQSGGDPSGGSPFIDWNTFQVYNNHWWDFADATRRDNQTASANLTQVFEGAGSHTLEYGLQYVDSTTAGENRQSVTGFNFISRDTNFCFDNGAGQPCATTIGGGGTVAPGDVLFNIDSTQDNRRLRALNLGGDQSIENLAAYVQDSWTLNDKWRLDLGLRYEEYSGQGPLNELNLDYDTVSPRLGVTYNIDENWQIQGTWGEYSGRLNDNWVQAVTNVGDAPGIDYQYTGPDFLAVDRTVVEQVLQDTHPSCAAQPSGSCWDTVLGVGDPDQPTTFLADDIESPHARDLNFTVKRALPNNSGTFTVGYTNREFVGLVDDFVGEFDSGIASITIEDPFDTTGTPATFPADATLWDNNPNAERTYQGLTGTINYRPSNVWSLGGNYTLSETTGNYEGEGQNTPGAGSPLGDYSNTRPTIAVAPEGFLDEDERHRVNVYGNYRFDFNRSGNLVLGGILQYGSGRAYSLTATSTSPGADPANSGDPGTFTEFFGGRGNQRFDSLWALDLSARYQVQLAKKLDAWIKLAIRNVTNEDTLETFNVSGSAGADPITGLNVFMPGGNFGNADSERDFQRPRQYLVTVGIDW